MPRASPTRSRSSRWPIGVRTRKGIPENSALPFIARRHGNPLLGLVGPMRPTPHLARCAYLMQVMAALDVPLGRSRLMRLDARAEATPHVDLGYYWQNRVRVHVPIVTFPDVQFLCGDASTHMAAGECWIFDTWRVHNVLNPGFEAAQLPRRRHRRQRELLGTRGRQRESAPACLSIRWQPGGSPEPVWLDIAPGVVGDGVDERAAGVGDVADGAQVVGEQPLLVGSGGDRDDQFAALGLGPTRASTLSMPSPST